MNKRKIPPVTLDDLEKVQDQYPYLDPLALNAYNELTRTTRMFTAALDNAAQARPTGQSVGRNAVLWCVINYPEEGITPAEIADALDVTRATVTGLLSGLEKDGLIVRIPSQEDRRRVHVRPSAKGLTAIETEWPQSSLDITRAMEPLSDREKKQLISLLKKIRRGVYAIRS